jgi:hypothetical protein
MLIQAEPGTSGFKRTKNLTSSTRMYRGGRYWIQTSDLYRVKDARAHNKRQNLISGAPEVPLDQKPTHQSRRPTLV